MESPAPGKFERHPIRLISVRPKSIVFDLKYVPETVAPDMREKLLPSTFDFRWGITEVLEGSKIQVMLGVDVKFPDDKLVEDVPPYELSAEVAAIATWSPDEISNEIVQAWAARGAQFALFPYLRALVSDLTAKSGFPVVILPLMILPTKIKKTSKDGDAQKEQAAPDGAAEKA